MLPLMFAGGGAVAAGCPELDVADTFTNTNGTQIENHGTPDWALNGGSLDINNNAVCPDTLNNNCAARWISDEFCADQYSQITIVAISATRNLGVAVRMATDNSPSYYAFITGTADAGVYFMDDGTLISDALAAVTVGQTMRLEVNGSTLTAKVNGVTVWTGTDANLSSGSPGIYGFSDSTASRMDNWAGGNL